MTSLSPITPSRAVQTASSDKRSPLRTAVLALAAPLLLTGAVLGAPAAASAAGPTADGSPFGHMDGISVEDGIMTVGGWTIDPDTSNAIEAHLYVDGRGVADIADYQRNDVASSYPASGPYHGFEIPIDIEPGEHSVCVFGINVAGGQNTLLECRDVYVPTGSPFGSLDQIVVEEGVMTVGGWTTDPDTTDPIEAHLYVDGVGVANEIADFVRDDVAATYPAFGPNHGFELSTDIAPGQHQVCVFGINVGAGGNTLIRCADVRIP
jgi:hypothetical protein